MPFKMPYSQYDIPSPTYKYGMSGTRRGMGFLDMFGNELPDFPQEGASFLIPPNIAPNIPTLPSVVWPEGWGQGGTPANVSTSPFSTTQGMSYIDQLGLWLTKNKTYVLIGFATLVALSFIGQGAPPKRGR